MFSRFNFLFKKKKVCTETHRKVFFNHSQLIYLFSNVRKHALPLNINCLLRLAFEMPIIWVLQTFKINLIKSQTIPNDLFSWMSAILSFSVSQLRPGAQNLTVALSLLNPYFLLPYLQMHNLGLQWPKNPKATGGKKVLWPCRWGGRTYWKRIWSTVLTTYG